MSPLCVFAQNSALLSSGCCSAFHQTLLRYIAVLMPDLLRLHTSGVPSVPSSSHPPLHAYFVRQARVSLEGVSLSLSDIRIVDGKFACYRITVAPATGARWEVRLGWSGRGESLQSQTKPDVCRRAPISSFDACSYSSSVEFIWGVVCVLCGEWWRLCHSRGVALRRCFLLQRRYGNGAYRVCIALLHSRGTGKGIARPPSLCDFRRSWCACLPTEALG